MAWTLLGDAIPSPLPVSDNSGSLTVDGSVSVSNLPATQPISGAYTELTGSASANATDVIASTDVRAYKSWTLQVTGSIIGNWQVQGSNDNSTWVALPFTQAGGTTSLSFTTTFSNTGAVTGSTGGFRYLRVRTTSYTSGTLTATLELSAQPSPALGVYIPPVTVAGPSSSAIDFMGGSIVSPIVQMGYIGEGSSSYDRVRVARWVKTATATASGDTALWTPTSTKKFRVMRYSITVPADAAMSGGGELDIILRDGTTAMPVGATLYVPGSAGTGFGAFTTGWVDLGNGLLSASANNVLNINLSAALTTGKVRVVCCGTEE